MMKYFVVLLLSIVFLSSCAKSKHKIGDIYKGGYIFKINIFGKGYVAAPKDYKTGIQWGCSGQLIEGANSEKRGKGKQNTEEIIAGCAQENTAAKVCDNLVVDSYDDWYLPSLSELELMYYELKAQDLGGFSEGNYWSSTQDFSYGAWSIDFGTGEKQNSRNKNDNGVRVRAIRSF
jgi:hypothetical protein